jgi:uncharacterized protein (TIGR00251 family)
VKTSLRADERFDGSRGPCTNAVGGKAATLRVHVVPGAPRDEILGMQGDTVRVRVAAPPVRGKANASLVKLLARTLGVKKDQIEIVSGHNARRKLILVQGTEKDAILALIRSLHSES